MRMIDADELLTERKMSKYYHLPNGDIAIPIIDIEHAPPVHPEPPKMGKWNVYYHGDNDFSYSCNQCGYGAPFDKMAGKVFQRKWKYCPNCGAYMGGKDDD